ERKKLAYGGAVSLVVTIDKRTGEFTGEPQIEFQGVAGIDPTNGFAANARTAMSAAVSALKQAQVADRNFLKETLRVALKRFIQQKLGTKPVIVTTIVEV
ncbi:MAG: hypothetical protein AAB288_14260, partial [Acidobacteriota bacterium]